MKIFTSFLLSLFISQYVNAQKYTLTLLNEVISFKYNQKKEYKDPSKSPLQNTQRKKFDHLNFFPVNIQYAVEGKFIRTANEKVFDMPVSGNSTKRYVKYGEVYFRLMS